MKAFNLMNSKKLMKLKLKRRRKGSIKRVTKREAEEATNVLPDYETTLFRPFQHFELAQNTLNH